MRLHKITWRHRDDFHWIGECENCGNHDRWGDGYADAFYCQRVIPDRHCTKCGMNSYGHKHETAAEPALASISGAQSEPIAPKLPVKDADPFPASDGWIKWAGGEMPVAGDICVHFRTKLNLEVPDASISEDDNRAADSLRWGWFDLRDDIVAYRVVSK